MADTPQPIATKTNSGGYKYPFDSDFVALKAGDAASGYNAITDQETNTDEINLATGALLEGELPSYSPMMPSFIPDMASDDDVPVREIAIFEAAVPVEEPPSSFIPAAAPVGWVRDISGNLWAHEHMSGLHIFYEQNDSTPRFQVIGHTAQGEKVFSTHVQDIELARSHMEQLALEISLANGYQIPKVKTGK